jgi:ankyrin repeat protein
MVDYLVVDINTETKDKQTALHLACGTGNVQIIGILIARGAYADYYDRCKRTPFMFALRNNNYEAFRMLINEGVKLYKCDSSLNSMLHCAAAYGNCPILKYLIGILKQTKNKSNLYPWEVAVGKGHLACAQLLDDHSTVEEERFDFSGNIMMNVMRNISGTQEAMDMLVYLLDTKHFGINAQDYNGFTLLHYCCSISEDDYIKSRMKELSGYSLRELKEEYRSVQDRVINLLISYGINKTIQNKNKETAFEMCVENANLTGIRLLMSDDIDLDYQTSNGLTILYYLGSIASLSNEEIKFVYNRIIK